MPVIGDTFGASTCIAFDLMSVNLADLPALPRLVPALKVSNAYSLANSLVSTLEVTELTMHRTVSCSVACRTDKTGSFDAIATMVGWCDLTAFCFAAPVQG